jgi:4-diphosphocytidyl-2-C-methyl-D-erythritol kinase
MLCFPNAKINLGLNIVSKRTDGYHNLETVFYPLKTLDALEIIVNENLAEDKLHQTGLLVDANPDDNLVMKAIGLMRKLYDFPPLEVHLLKKIPSGAGLGGGSADASFMLKLLNSKFQLGATDDQLARIALQLGADCPFFIYNRPLFASGIGEIFEEVELSLEDYYFILSKPNIHVSTKDAFGGIEPRSPKISLKEAIKAPLEEWKHIITNDFERTVFSKYPEIGLLKDQLYEAGALYASMSGSGSSVYAIFSKKTVFTGEITSYQLIEP